MAVSASEILSETSDIGLERPLPVIPVNFSYPFFLIPALDKLVLPLLLNHYKKLHETRHHIPGHKPPPEHHSFPLPFIELASTSPCSGKTHLLYLICTVSVLPRSYCVPTSPTSPTPRNVQLNGKNGVIVVLDCDYRFSIRRLCMVMKHYIFSHLTEEEKAQHGEAFQNPAIWVESLILASLKRIFVFRPISSTEQLLETLISLPEFLLSTLTNPLQTLHLAGILIDSVSSFYWQDRAGDSIPTSSNVDEELLAQQAPAFPLPGVYVNPMTTLTSKYQPLVKQIHALQKLFGCFVVTTRRLHMVQRQAQITLQNPLPGAWTMAVTIRIMVNRELKDQEQKIMEEVDNGGGWFRGSIDGVGGAWGGREGLELLKNEIQPHRGSVMRFWIGRGGVKITE